MITLLPVQRRSIPVHTVLTLRLRSIQRRQARAGVGIVWLRWESGREPRGAVSWLGRGVSRDLSHLIDTPRGRLLYPRTGRNPAPDRPIFPSIASLPLNQIRHRAHVVPHSAGHQDRPRAERSKTKTDGRDAARSLATVDRRIAAGSDVTTYGASERTQAGRKTVYR